MDKEGIKKKIIKHIRSGKTTISPIIEEIINKSKKKEKAQPKAKEKRAVIFEDLSFEDMGTIVDASGVVEKIDQKVCEAILGKEAIKNLSAAEIAFRWATMLNLVKDEKINLNKKQNGKRKNNNVEENQSLNSLTNAQIGKLIDDKLIDGGKKERTERKNNETSANANTNNRRTANANTNNRTETNENDNIQKAIVGYLDLRMKPQTKVEFLAGLSTDWYNSIYFKNASLTELVSVLIIKLQERGFINGPYNKRVKAEQNKKNNQRLIEKGLMIDYFAEGFVKAPDKNN